MLDATAAVVDSMSDRLSCICVSRDLTRLLRILLHIRVRGMRETIPVYCPFA